MKHLTRDSDQLNKFEWVLGQVKPNLPSKKKKKKKGNLSCGKPVSCDIPSAIILAYANISGLFGDILLTQHLLTLRLHKDQVEPDAARATNR